MDLILKKKIHNIVQHGTVQHSGSGSSSCATSDVPTFCCGFCCGGGGCCIGTAGSTTGGYITLPGQDYNCYYYKFYLIHIETNW